MEDFPDFEARTDIGGTAGDNDYVVRLYTWDGSLSSDTVAVTVSVTNVEEPGVVTLSPSQPQAGAWVTAALREPDGEVNVNVPNGGWHWQRRANETAMWENITSSRTRSEFFQGPSYQPVAADVGQMLRATVSYTDGESADATDLKSSQSAATVPVRPGAPGKPTLEASGGDRRVTLTWTPAPDNGSKVTGYQYRQSTQSGSIGSQPWVEITGSTAATRSDTVTDHLTNGQPYTFQVRAQNGEGDGLASNSAEATPANRPPNPPSGLTSVVFAEESSDTVATYGLSDVDEGAVLTLKKEGPDAASFRISGDTLYFKEMEDFPDFSARTDIGGTAGDNDYVVGLYTRGTGRCRRTRWR